MIKSFDQMVEDEVQRRLADRIKEAADKRMEAIMKTVAAPPPPPRSSLLTPSVFLNPTTAPPPIPLPYPTAAHSFRNLIEEITGLIKSNKLTKDEAISCCQKHGVMNFVEIFNRLDLVPKVRNSIRNFVTLKEIESIPPSPSPKPRKRKSFNQMCPTGSWIALAGGDFDPLGQKTNRLKAYMIVKDLLKSGPAPRKQVAKLLAETLRTNYNNATCLISHLMKSGHVVRVTEPILK